MGKHRGLAQVPEVAADRFEKLIKEAVTGLKAWKHEDQVTRDDTNMASTCWMTWDGWTMVCRDRTTDGEIEKVGRLRPSIHIRGRASRKELKMVHNDMGDPGHWYCRCPERAQSVPLSERLRDFPVAHGCVVFLSPRRVCAFLVRREGTGGEQEDRRVKRWMGALAAVNEKKCAACARTFFERPYVTRCRVGVTRYNEASTESERESTGPDWQMERTGWLEYGKERRGERLNSEVWREEVRKDDSGMEENKNIPGREIVTMPENEARHEAAVSNAGKDGKAGTPRENASQNFEPRPPVERAAGRSGQEGGTTDDNNSGVSSGYAYLCDKVPGITPLLPHLRATKLSGSATRSSAGRSSTSEMTNTERHKGPERRSKSEIRPYVLSEESAESEWQNEGAINRHGYELLHKSMVTEEYVRERIKTTGKAVKISAFIEDNIENEHLVEVELCPAGGGDTQGQESHGDEKAVSYTHLTLPTTPYV